MTKGLRVFILLCTLPLLGAFNPVYVKVKGVSGAVLSNVLLRLNEAYPKQSIREASPSELKTLVHDAITPYGYFKSEILITPGRPIRIQIIPGPRMKVGSFQLQIRGSGKQNPEIQQAVHDFPLFRGKFLNSADYEEAKSMLISAAEHQGYLKAAFKTATIQIDIMTYTARIHLIFDTGPRYRFGTVHFDPTYVSPKLLARFIPWKPGQAYSTDDVLAFNSALNATGYFKSVVVKPNLDNRYDVPIDVHTERSDRINYSLGAGYGTDTGPRGRAGLSIIPVNREGHKFNAAVQGSLNQNAFISQYIVPGKNPNIDNFSLNGSFTNLSYNSGNSNALLFALAQQHVLSNYQRILSLNFLNERYNYSGQSAQTETLIYPQASLTFRKISNELFSPTGYNATFTAFASAKAFASSVSVAQGSFDLKVAFTHLPTQTRLFFHTILVATGIQDINNLPLSLAPLLGGSDNLKGYSFNSIGPGKYATYAGFEIQKEFIEKWYFTAGLDSGDVYQPALKMVKYDVSAGLMWVSPVGPIKVAVAQAVNNSLERVPDLGPKLVISMGPDL